LSLGRTAGISRPHPSFSRSGRGRRSRRSCRRGSGT
jgi:hypothetical protein